MVCLVRIHFACVTSSGYVGNDELLHAVETSTDFDNILLASCPWGPVTANGVDILTEMYVLYMKRDTSHEAPRSNGLGATGVQ